MIRRTLLVLLALVPLLAGTSAPATAQSQNYLWWWSQKTIVAVQLMGQRVTGRPVSEDMVRKALTFTAGATLFTSLHEAGHMLVSELGLPVLGKEEDAVDTFATVMMLLADDDRFDRAVRDAASEWWLEHNQSATLGYEFPFYAEHSPEKSRAANIACLAVGYRPEAFASYADNLGIPRERQERCYWDWQQAYESWARVLADGFTETSKGRNNFSVVYDQLPPERRFLQMILKESTILETLSQVLIGGLAVPNHITFRGAECGQANAFWSPAAREVTMCYELIETFLELIFAEQARWSLASSR